METGFLIVAHKPIATAMFTVAQGILGSIKNCIPIDIVSDEPKDNLQQQIKDAWEKLNTQQIVVLLDLEGATPCNLLKNFCSGKECLQVAPLSLPLLLKLLSYRELEFKDLALKAKQIQVTTNL